MLGFFIPIKIHVGFTCIQRNTLYAYSFFFAAKFAITAKYIIWALYRKPRQSIEGRIKLYTLPVVYIFMIMTYDEGHQYIIMLGYIFFK